MTAPLLSQDRSATVGASRTGHAAPSADAHMMGTVGTIGEDRQPVRPMPFLGAFNETGFPDLLPDDFHIEHATWA